MASSLRGESHGPVGLQDSQPGRWSDWFRCSGAKPPTVTPRISLGIGPMRSRSAPKGAPFWGVDVLSWQGSINCSGRAAAGNSFAIALIADGTYKAYRLRRELGRNEGGPGCPARISSTQRASIQLPRPTSSSAAVGKLGAGDLPATAHLESGGGKASVAQLQTWVSVVTSGTGKAPMIYTAEGYWDGTYDGDFNTYPLWVANWGVSCPDMPNGWSNWSFWQSSG